MVCQLLRPEGQELVTMLNLNSKPELKEGLASISSHVTFGRLTPHLQSVRPSIEGGDLLSQGASNAFQPSCCQEPYPIEQCYPTAILNFYRYLLTRSATPKGIRTVFINNQYVLEGFKVLDPKEEDIKEKSFTDILTFILPAHNFPYPVCCLWSHKFHSHQFLA